MIKILEEKKVPRGTVRCTNCDSLLEYGNADLSRFFSYDELVLTAGQNGTYKLTCPVCGCSVIAKWVLK